VAARLTAAGIPAVLAMSHSVLVPTTRMLFGQFYKDLARVRPVGESLDIARRFLKNNPRKYEVQRGPKRIWLELQDWFLPALYQSGEDVPLLTESDEEQEVEVAQPSTNLPKPPEAGFFGRGQELWDIEKWFSDKARRITITGFGGQGKTALAEEAGRWLLRTGMFKHAVIAYYARVQSRDSVSVAVSTIGSVLGETLIDAKAAEKALKKTPTLVILDNLEALAEESLKELLDAAVLWSGAGDSRVLCTTRKPDFDHPEYKVEGSLEHRRISLTGLGSLKAPGDALEWYTHLMKLPPAPVVAQPDREDLANLFHKVNFHPLSIRVLAQQLKTRRPAELGPRLEHLLAARRTAASSAASDTTLPELVASLQLSLDTLDDAARQMLPRLGVFQGGAMQSDLLAITQISEDVWLALRQQLESAALIEDEDLPGVTVPFLRFHPTLALMLWEQLSSDGQAALSLAHRQRYRALTYYLHNADMQNPREARAIAWRELPNILHAVHGALDTADDDAVGFANSVNSFLKDFGLRRESEALIAKVQAATSEVGSRSWYLLELNRGDRLLSEGRIAEAEKVLRTVLDGLGEEPSFERAATLVEAGRCFRQGGRPAVAARMYQEAISVLDQLDQTDSVKRQRAACLTDMADALRDQGRYADARKAYEDGLEIYKELDDFRGQVVILSQLGTLAMLEGNLEEAIERHRANLALFQQLGEPEAEAIIWHQLGMVFQAARKWDEAERHYRKAARIKEEHGMISGPNGAASTWNQLATLSVLAGKPEAAEMWFRKVIHVCRDSNDHAGLSISIHNLAVVLMDLPGRLIEARQLAEEALAIGKTLDPGAAEIWRTYGILADIAEKEAASTSDSQAKAESQKQAAEYRRLAHDAKRNFAGTRHELRKHGPLIAGTVLATHLPEPMAEFEEFLARAELAGRTKLVAAIRSILGGERNADTLCESLDLEDSMIVEAILQGLEDPSSLQDLLPDKEQDEQDST
jgi:tetratricopeptide (TPR) repeat protein